MAAQESVNWVSVLSFLQKQQTQSTIREKQWNLQRTLFTDKINRLEAELDSNRIMINDLINRIKLLQIALFETKTNNGTKIGANGDEESIKKVENLIEKYKLEVKVKQENSQQFLASILGQIGMDYKQILNQAQPVNELNSKIYGVNGIQKQKSVNIKETGSFNAHLDGVRKIYMNEGQDFAITVSEDCLVKIWNYSALKKLKHENFQSSNVFREHTGPLFTLTGGPSPFNPQESVFFTGGSQGLIKYWKVKNKSYYNSAVPISNWNNGPQSDVSSAVWDLALNSKNLLSSVSDGFVTLYQITENDKGTLKIQFKEKQFHPTCISWLSTQTFIEGCCNAPRAHLWDLNGKLRQRFLYDIDKGDQPQKHQINEISFNSHTKMIVMGCQDGALRLFSPGFNRMIRKMYVDISISCVKSMTDWQIVCGTHSGSLSIWDLRKYQKVLQFEKCHQTKYDEGILCLWAQPDRVFTGGADGSIKIFS